MLFTTLYLSEFFLQQVSIVMRLLVETIDMKKVDCRPCTSKKSRLLKFCYVPVTSTAPFKGIFAVVTNSTN